MMEWNGLRVLLAVVDGGSFSAAARALRVSQPTVGRQMAALETALGARLVVRRKRGIALTPAGEQMIEDVRRMGHFASEAARHGTEDVKEVEGLVRIAATEGIGALWLPHRLLSLRDRHPRLRIELTISNATVDLSRREADVALRLLRPKQPGLIARRVATLGLGFFAAPSYLDAHGTPRKLQDLARHDLIGFGEAGPLPPYMAWLRKLAPRERFVLVTSGLLAQQEAARAGWGLALAPTYFLSADTRLRRVLPRIKVPSVDVWLLVHEDIRRSARVSVVYQALVELLERDRAGLSGSQNR
jgi:DNA-binding transcriptional LysR family regulator